MAKTEFGVNHPLTVKVWSKKLFFETIEATYIKKFMGTSKDSLLYRKDELEKGAGDRIRCGLRMQLNGAGVLGDATLEGEEEAAQFYYDDLVIDQLRHATRVAGKMTEQRVPYDLRADNKDGLRDWHSDRLDTAFFNQLGGYTPANSDLRYTGQNSVGAIDSNHIIRRVAHTSDASISTADTFALSLIDQCVVQAKTMRQANGLPIIRPLKVEGEDHYVMFLHPYQAKALRTSTNTGDWLDIQKAVVSGGAKTKNPIFDGSLGVYNGVILHEAVRVPAGVDAAGTGAVANTRRAIFCGAQAGLIGYANSDNSEKMTWFEEMFDYGNQLGVGAGYIGGLKGTFFNGSAYGRIIVPTYASAS
jgi:N4-gp56 family major capsid protein